MPWIFRATEHRDIDGGKRRIYYGPCPADLKHRDELNGTHVQIEMAIYRVLGTEAFLLMRPPKKDESIGILVSCE